MNYTIEKINEIVNEICSKNNISPNIFEVSSISKATGGKSERLENKTKVKNKNVNFVIKYYIKLNIIVIWNYSANTNMNYSYKTIKEKINNGIRYADKGSEFHTKNQYLIYFDKAEKLRELLKLIINPI